MFPTGKLFDDILCPNYTTCTLSPCLYSHQLPSRPVVGVRNQSLNSSNNVPQKRSGESLEPSGTTKVTKSDSSSSRSTMNSISSTSSSRIQPIASTSTSSSTSSTSLAQRELVDNGPPRINIVGITHTPFPIRHKMLMLTYDHFVQAYSALPDQTRAKILAADHSKAQEQTIYSRSNKANYRNSIISALTRIKKRPLATSEDATATGTLEEEAARLKAVEEAEKGKLTKERIKKYVSTKEVLIKYDYFMELPIGVSGDQETEEGNIRKCNRCGKEFLVKSELEEAEGIACSFHYGRMVTEKLGGIKERVFSCCPTPGAVTCSQGPHVFTDKSIEKLHSRIPFILTSSLNSVKSSIIPKLHCVALDCELVYTTSGMALARLTVIDDNGLVVLDEKIRPQGKVLDLNTRFSGVKEKDITDAIMDIKAVREALGQFIGIDTVIVGHGLENDLKALRLIHPNVIDTAIIFPHPRGIPWRHALRNLSRDILGKFIQDGDPSLGHSAVEDSKAALELLRWKVKQDSTR